MHDWPKLLTLLLDIIANVKIPVGVGLPAPLTMLSVALGKRWGVPDSAIRQEHMQISMIYIDISAAQLCSKQVIKSVNVAKRQ